MKKTLRRLPNGKYTSSTRRYLTEWHKLIKEIEKRLPSYQVYAYDPGFALCNKKIAVDTCHLSMSFVNDLLKLGQN